MIFGDPVSDQDPSKTDEEFEKHVCEIINPAWVQLIKRHEVMKYSIVSFSPANMPRLVGG